MSRSVGSAPKGPQELLSRIYVPATWPRHDGGVRQPLSLVVSVPLQMPDQSSDRPGPYLVLRQLLLEATGVGGKGMRYAPMARIPLTGVSSTDWRGEL